MQGHDPPGGTRLMVQSRSSLRRQRGRSRVQVDPFNHGLRDGSTVPWSMIISIQMETDSGGHDRHVMDVGDGYGRDAVMALELLRIALCDAEWPMVGDVGGELVRFEAGSVRQIVVRE
jgi:hypothetical protein